MREYRYPGRWEEDWIHLPAQHWVDPATKLIQFESNKCREAQWTEFFLRNYRTRAAYEGSHVGGIVFPRQDTNGPRC